MKNLWDYRECVLDYRESTWTLDRDLLGYDVEATCARIGKVLRVHSEPLGACIVVDTSAFFGRRRLVPAGLVAGLDHHRRLVGIDLAEGQVRNAPEYEDDLWDDHVRAEHAAYYEDQSA